MQVLAIDWGGKRIGLAIATAPGGLPSPLPVVPNNSRLFASLKAIAVQYQVEQLVLGLPLGLDGQDTPQTQQIRRWGVELARQVGLPVKLQAETLTTKGAMIDGRFGGADEDSVAAAIILQDYLATAA